VGLRLLKKRHLFHRCEVHDALLVLLPSTKSHWLSSVVVVIPELIDPVIVGFHSVPTVGLGKQKVPSVEGATSGPFNGLVRLVELFPIKYRIDNGRFSLAMDLGSRLDNRRFGLMIDGFSQALDALNEG
jgi:hypothetical protein